MWIMTLSTDRLLYPMFLVGRICRGIVRLKRSSTAIATRGYMTKLFLEIVTESRTDSSHDRFGGCRDVSVVG